MGLLWICGARSAVWILDLRLRAAGRDDKDLKPSAVLQKTLKNLNLGLDPKLHPLDVAPPVSAACARLQLWALAVSAVTQREEKEGHLNPKP